MSTPISRRPPSAVSAVFLIARREFVTRVRSRVFIIGTVLVLVALAGYLVFQVLVLNKHGPNKTYKVAYFGEAQSLAAPFTAA